MSPKKKILGVDFDGVLMQCTEAMVEYQNLHYGTSFNVEDITSFEWGEAWGCSAKEAERRFNEFVQTEFHDNADEVAGAREALKKLNEHYEIVIVTGRQESAREATGAWLMKNFFGLYREIHFTENSSSDHSKRRPKSAVVKETGISLFIDDGLHFAKDVAQAGVPVFLFDAPWNHSQTPPGAERVYSWGEIVERLIP